MSMEGVSDGARDRYLDGYDYNAYPEDAGRSDHDGVVAEYDEEDVGDLEDVAPPAPLMDDVPIEESLPRIVHTETGPSEVYLGLARDMLVKAGHLTVPVGVKTALAEHLESGILAELSHSPVEPGRDPAKEFFDQTERELTEGKLVDRLNGTVNGADRPEAYESLPIPDEEVPGRAFRMAAVLQEAVGSLNLTEESRTEVGGVVRKYSGRQPLPSDATREVTYEAVLTYRDAQAGVPVSAQLEIVDPHHGLTFENRLVVRTGQYEDGLPEIYQNSHPFHREDYGNPQRNTEQGYARAQRMIDSLPKPLDQG